MVRLLDKALFTRSKQIQAALDHIEHEWDRFTIHAQKDKDTLIGLPNPYVVPSVDPNDGFVYKEMYYWDSLFIVIEFCTAGKVELAKGIVDNLLFLVERFGMVPNANRFYMLSRSQPPFLTTMIRAVYEQTEDKDWLGRAFKTVKKEYAKVWLGSQQPHNRQVFAGLSRYYDINMLHQLAEAESGWDYTPRFENRCLDFLPVDLNCALYAYEHDFAWIALQFEQSEEADKWLQKAEARAEAMRKLMWNEQWQLFLDYDFVNERQAESLTLASYMPLFVGLANEQEAAEAHERLARFETNFGLSTTDLAQGVSIQKQWGMPNGWAPLHYIVIQGLRRYGYEPTARRIALKWLKLNTKVFNKTGLFYEKYNVLRGNNHVLSGVYPSQTGFAWTNAIFALLAREFLADRV